jgi:hypothetical protein
MWFHRNVGRRINAEAQRTIALVDQYPVDFSSDGNLSDAMLTQVIVQRASSRGALIERRVGIIQPYSG